MTQHRVELVEFLRLLSQFFIRYADLFGQCLDFFICMRKEFVERWIQQTNGYRSVSHCLVDSLEVALLIRQQEFQSFSSFFFAVSQDHSSYSRDSFFFEEHVLSSAKSDTFCAEFYSLLSISRVVSICSDLQCSDFISPGHDFCKVSG